MDEKTFNDLEIGDVLRSVGSANSLIITEKLADGYYIGVRTCRITNPSKWNLIWKANYMTHKEKP